ncbi:MAG: hypothetical protein ACXWUG_29095 [Polyangiales bacterium]
MKRALLFISLVGSASCSADKSFFPDKPRDIEVVAAQQVATGGKPSSRDNRLPITFDTAAATTFTLDMKMRNLDGSTRTSFNGWTRLTLAPAGQIVQAIGPAGEDDPNVAGPNVHFVNGEAHGIQVKIVGAYGDTRIVAQDVGFVPAPPGKLAACADGKDNDDNGLADYPVDPNCLFLNDDSEEPFDASYGTSDILYYDSPTVFDVQTGTISPFLAKQVDLQAATHHLVVTGVTNNGMYVSDVTDTMKQSNSVFVFTFSAPFGVQACDTLTRLSGNVSDFFGMLQLGTPGFTAVPWINPVKSGACPIPPFIPVDGTFAAIAEKVEALESSLVSVKEPEIGTKFGKDKVPVVDGAPTPDVGKSNCDLNGDGIVGFNKNKGGFNDLEKACNDACTADPDCTEWNNYLQFNQVKIKFQPGDAVLFMSPSAIPGFDAVSFAGPGKFAEIRGIITNFVGPTPAYSVEPRCVDDVIYAGTPAANIKNEKTACVRNRIGVDAEGSN